MIMRLGVPLSSSFQFMDGHRGSVSVKKSRVLIVDGQALFCEALAALFSTKTGLKVVALTTRADEAVLLARRLQPDIVFMDTSLPELGSFDAARQILSHQSKTKVIFLEDTLCGANVQEALRLGARGYWTKHESFQAMADGVCRVAAGGSTFCPDIQRRLKWTSEGLQFDAEEKKTPLEKLTQRELEVLRYLSQGLSVKQCARILNLAHSTVDNHKSRLMKKLDVHNSVELTRLAIREGLVPN